MWLSSDRQDALRVWIFLAESMMSIPIGRVAWLVVILFMFSLTAQAATRWVGGCGPGANYATIQAAIAAASAGDTISICPGSYSGQVGVDKDNLIITSSTGNANDVILTHGSDVFLLKASNLTLRGMTVNSSGGHGIVDSWPSSGQHVFENLVIRARNDGFRLQQYSIGAHTFRNLDVTCGNTCIKVAADGPHVFENVTIEPTAGTGIAANVGASLLQNIRITSNSDAIRVGNKYPLIFDTVSITSNNGYGIQILTFTTARNDMRFSHVEVHSKNPGIYIQIGGRIEMEDVSVSSKGNAIHLEWDVQGAHRFSRLKLTSADGAGLFARYGLASVTDFDIVAKSHGIYATSFFDAEIRRGSLSSSDDHGLYWRWGTNLPALTVSDVNIQAKNSGIYAERAATISVRNVCVLRAQDGLVTEWYARNLSLQNSRFQNFSGYGVKIKSDPAYKATVTGNAFLKPNAPRAYSNSTAHRFDGNYWQGVPGGTPYVDGNVRDSATLGSDPVAACYDPSASATLIAHYRMEDAAWNGTSGEWRDSSGNGYHGNTGASGVSPRPTVQTSSPARPGNPGTCGYGNVGRQVGNGDGVAAFNTAALPVSMASGEAVSVSFWMKWNGTSDVSFVRWDRYALYSRGNNFGFTTSNWSLDIFGTNKPQPNQWVHVAAVFVNGDITASELYLNGVKQTLSTRQGPHDNMAAFVTPTLSVAKKAYNDHHRYAGDIDEVKVFNGRLTQAQVTTLYNETHPCISGFHHIRIEAPSSAVTCERLPVTFRACADAGCTSLYAGGDVQINLAPAGQWYAALSGGSALGNPQTIPTSGSLTLYLQQSTPATIPVSASHAGGPAPSGTPSFTCNGDTAAAPCNVSFVNAGLIFTAAKPGASAVIPTHIAGRISAQYYVRAVQSDQTTGACTAALNGGTASLSFQCIDPGSCSSGGPWMNFAPTSPVFDADGYAPFRFTYDDAGRIKLTAQASSNTGAQLNGESNAFVVKPAALCVTSSDTLGCPAADHTCPPFRKAGETFDLTVTAVRDGYSCADPTAYVTPNYRENAIVLGSETVAPSGGPGSVGVANLAITSAGTGSVAQSISEVGVFRFTASPPAYFGETIGSPPFKSEPFGRFYPHHFDTEVNHACGGFTYSGQPFPLKVTARNLAGAPTVNYTGAFAKTVMLSDANGSAGAFNPPTLTAGDFTAGEADKTNPASVSFAFTSKLTAPATLKVRTSDGEATSADGTEGTTPLRSGRLVLSNAHGSEQLGLTMPVQTQYWDGTAWVTNTLDSCTAILGSLVFVKTPASMPSPTGGALNAGKGSLNFIAPNQKGSVEVCANIGSDTDNPLAGCRNGSSHPWLQGSWDADGNYNDNPAARATFGIFKGRDPVIYRRERY